MTDTPPMHVVTTCARCGDELVLSAKLVEQLKEDGHGTSIASLVHDVCPRDRRERRFAVKIEVTELVDDEDAEAEAVGGFTVTIGATTLREAIEKATPEMTEKWTRLYETAHLADEPQESTMPGLLPDDDQETL